MPIERRPKNPRPRNYVPIWGSPYPVQDDDTWRTVASKHELDVDTLIWFNFGTHNPDEVNWYLHYYVGCKLHDDKNWKFSRSAKPGIIYLYKNPVFPPPWVNPLEEMGARNALARFLDAHADEVPENHNEVFHFVLDSVELSHITLAVIGGEAIEISAGVAVLDILAPFAAEVAVFLGIASGYADAIESLKRKKYAEGISEGIVLGANRASAHWIGVNFWKNKPVDVPYFPEQGENLEHIYNLGLATGYHYGRQLNVREARMLFHELNVNMPPIRENPEMEGDYWSHWGSHAKKIYYEDAAIVFRHLHMTK